MASKKRPGVMLYFDLRPCLKALSLEQKGLLFDSILSYGEIGVVPQFDDSMLTVAWNFIQPKIDADAERYKKRCKKAQESANARWGNVTENTEYPNGCERIPTHTNGYEGMRSMPTTTSTTTNSLVPPSTGTKKPKQVFEPDSLPYRAARWLADQIEERLPNCTPHSETTLQNWAADFDKCHRLDGHSWEDIDKVLQFSQFDSFWQSNILSGGKFRKQYTQLLAKMGGGGT